MNTAKVTIIEPVPQGFIDNRELPVLPYRNHVQEAQCSGAHSHPRGQFIYALQGITRVETRQGIYLVPPSLAFWCPPHQEHALYFYGNVIIANLFVDEYWSKTLADQSQLYRVSPLLRSLVIRALDIGTEYYKDTPEYRIMEIILDEIRQLDISPLSLPWSNHKTLQPVLRQLQQQPGDNTSLEAWSDRLHVSSRTLSRHFIQETGMTFHEWKTQARLLLAIEKLLGGESVTSVALDVGYSNASAFIAVFRKHLGKTPTDYVEQLISA